MDAAIVLALFVLALALFAWEKAAVDVVTLLLLVALMLTGVLTPQEAFSGFASEVLFILAAISVICGGLQRSGVLEFLASTLLRFAGRGPRRLVAALMTCAATVSAGATRRFSRWVSTNPRPAARMVARGWFSGACPGECRVRGSARGGLACSRGHCDSLRLHRSGEGSSFGLAMEKSGAARILADWVNAAIGPLGPFAVMAGFFVLTVILTQPMSNAAAALVVLPVALTTASEIGADPRTFAIAVMLAASVSFITPFEPSACWSTARGATASAISWWSAADSRCCWPSSRCP